MKRQNIILIALFATGLFLFSTRSVEAAYFRFNPASISAVNGNTFQISVIVDSGTDEILSSDAYVLFDSKLLQATAVNDGTYFPYVVHNITPGKVSIRGLVTDAATSRTGSGTLASITFQVLAPGAATLSFFCDMNASDTSKIVKNDINATNIIVCTQNNTATITAITPTVAPSGSVTPTPTGTGGNGGGGGAGGTSGTGTGASGNNAGQQGGPGNGGNASIGTGQNVDNNRPTALPRSGAFDNLKGIGIAGSALFVVGGVAALLL